MKLAADGEVKRLTYVVGNEPVLAEMIVDMVRMRVDAKEENYVSLTAGEVPDREVWAALNQYALDPQARRLIVVRDAHKLRSVKKLEDWLTSRHMPNSYCVMVSTQDDWPHKVEIKDSKKVKTYFNPEVRDRIVRSGRFVDVAFPKSDESRAKAVVAILTAWGRIAPNTAVYLYNRTGGDMGACRDALMKAALFSGEVTERVVDFLTQPSAEEDYANNLLARRSGLAAMASQQVPDEQVQGMLGRLESDLVMLGRIHRAQKRSQMASQLANQLGVHRVRIDSLQEHAKHYDSDRVASCLQALAAADDAWRRGARDGVLEMLAATW